jgi:hypothetical protein
VSAYRFEQEKMVEVAVVNTQAEADLLKMTLAAHGFQVQISAPSSVYPRWTSSKDGTSSRA